MRIPLALGAALLGLTAGPALAQVQLSNPNAANESFALQSQFRTLNQQQTSQFNVLNMQAQRNVQFAPPAPFAAATRWCGTGTGRSRHGAASTPASAPAADPKRSGAGRDKSRFSLPSPARSVQNRVR